MFVVWEPVLATDWGTPSPSLTGYVADSRVVHFWDRGRGLSALLGGPPKLNALADDVRASFRMKDVVWDTALLYPAGKRWGSPGKLLVAPVVKHGDELSAALAR